MEMSRRQVLLAGGLGTLGVLGGVSLPLGIVEAKSASRLRDRDMPRPYRTPFVQPPVLPPESTTVEDGQPLAVYSVTEQAAVASILPTLPTTILGYNGIFPGPTIKVERGTRVVLRVRNRLPITHPLSGHVMATSTHLHGSASLPQFDGYASDVTNCGYKKYYRYPNFQPARTIWYHDHSVHHTALNAYFGLAGQYHIHDEFERTHLPQGEFDVPITITDAIFAEDGSLAYDDDDHSGLMGDVVLVNGRPWPVMRVKRRVYRFRLLNASISRSYRLTLSTGGPMTVVATDGGLMPRPQTVTSFRHAGAERYEVLIDFSQYPVGQRVELRNLSNKNNRDYDHTNKVMAFDVVGDEFDRSDPTAFVVEPDLSGNVDGMEVMDLRAVKGTKVREFRLRRDDATNIFSIDYVTWQDVIASGFTKVAASPPLGAVEIWQFRNSSGGWFHPLHTHLIDFQVLSRNGRAPFAYELGPKDTVYIGEGETVRFLARFGPHKGRYMIHCHNMPHEDHDMMVQFNVGGVDPATDPNDPIHAAYPVWDDDPD